MYRIKYLLITFMMVTNFLVNSVSTNNYTDPIIIEDIDYSIINEVHDDEIVEESEQVQKFVTNAHEESLVDESSFMSDEDIYILALVTLAEAEGESELGKRLVIDTVLNRMDNEHFPDTIYDVVYQKNQFSAMRSDRVNRVNVTDEICQLIKEELKNRTNYDVIFFNAKDYSKYGSKLFSEGNHYFSSYN